MKPMLLAALSALVLPLSAQQPVSPEALLDKIVTYPGSYAQVCDVMTAPTDIPYRAYQVTSFAGASFSKANLAQMEGNRDGVVKALRKRLLEIDFVRQPVEPKKDPAPEESHDGEDVGCDPHVLNPLLLEMILHLKATEALPELLVLEEKLVKGIAVAKDSVKAAPPVVTGWYVGQENFDYDENEPEAKRDRRVNLFQARVAQRDLVLTMGRLLREAGYESYRTTAIEKAYVAGLKKEAKAEGYLDYKPGGKLPAGKEYLELVMDPFSNVPRDIYASVAVPYSRESRDEVRAVASKWIAEH
ncbi:MAG: hypothetical protein KF712_13420 [Akkermansiaceae bacterium]|nr:hypothetical protein [Akkermansiaceae bacterium]